MKLRRFLPSLVLWFFPVVVVAVVSAVVAGVVIAGGLLFDSQAPTNVVLRILVVPLVAAVFFGVRAALKHTPQPAQGVEVTPSEHPRLWAEIGRLSALARTTPPTRIVVVADVNAAVTEATGQREMEIGFPLLATLTTDELRAVLAHELGHFAGGDTAADAKIARRVTFMLHVAQQTGVPWRWFFQLYTRLYALAAAPVSREAELRADELAVAAAGSVAAASALRAVLRAGIAEDILSEHLVSEFALAGRRASLGEGLRQILAANRAAIDEAVEEELAAEHTSGYDTHPAARERISRFDHASPARVDSLDGDAPALALLSGGSAWLDEAEGAFVASDLPLASWEEVATVFSARSLDDAASRVARSMVELGLGDGGLDSVLSLIDTGNLVEQFSAEPGPEELDEAISMLCDVILAALFAVGKARVKVTWTGPHAIIPSDGSGIMTSERVAAAIEASDSTGLRTWLTGLGVDISTARPSGHILSEWLGAVSHVEGPWEGRRDVHLFSDGILAMPALDEETIRENKEQIREKHQHARLYAVPERGAGSARALKDALWWDADAITGGQVGGTLRLRLSFLLDDGTELALHTTLESAFVPSPEDIGVAVAQLGGEDED